MLQVIEFCYKGVTELRCETQNTIGESQNYPTRHGILLQGSHRTTLSQNYAIRESQNYPSGHSILL